MNKPTITAWLKTSCGWSNGVRAVLGKYGLEYEEKDIIKNPAFRWEMEQKSGQDKQPTLEVNGTMLPDVSGEELEAWPSADAEGRHHDRGNGINDETDCEKAGPAAYEWIARRFNKGWYRACGHLNAYPFPRDDAATMTGGRPRHM